MRIKYSYFLAIVLISYSCQRISSPVLQIDITNGIKKNINLNLSSIASEIRVVPLETKKNCLIGRVVQMMIKDTFIFVQDNYYRIFIFNQYGKLLANISNKGKGPEEYLNISRFDVSISDKLVYILDKIKLKIFIFDFHGNFVKAKDLEKTHTSDFCLLNDNTFVFYYVKPALPNSNYYRILLYDKEFRQIGNLQRIKKENIDYLSQPWPLTKMVVLNSKMYYWEATNDTVYFIENNKVHPHFVFKYDEYHLPDDILNSPAKSLRWKGKYLEVSNFFETPSHIFVTARFDVYRRYIIYNKKDGSNFNVVFNYDIYDNGFHNDLDGGIPFWPKGQTDKGELFDYMNPYDLKELISKPYFKSIKVINKTNKEQLMKLLDKSKMEDNPIVFIVN